MKKRSLLAAVAMLMVSAIVLTSATYAWFAAGDSAQIGNPIASTVSNSAGSLLISADGGTTWATTIEKTDFTAATGTFTDAFVPVSVTPDINSFDAVSGTITNGAFTGETETDVNGYYTMFQFKIKATADSTIQVTPNFSTAVNYGYCYVIVEGGALTKTGYLFGVSGAGRQYNPVAASATPITATDANNNSILDSGEGATLSSQQTTVAKSIPNISATTETEYTFTVYMWAEGNDPDCKGSVNASAISIDFGFSK